MDDATADYQGAPLGELSVDRWMEQVAAKYRVPHWTNLTDGQRMESLYYLYDSKDRDRFEEVVQNVTTIFPDSPVEHLENETGVSLLPHLSTPLAVKVVRSHTSGIFSLKHVPSLMRQGICPQKLDKLLKVSQEPRVRRRLMPSAVSRMETIPEREAAGSGVGGSAAGMIRDDGGSPAAGVRRESFELSLRLNSYQAQVVIKADDTKEFLENVLKEDFRTKVGSKLDVYCQRMLALCGSCVNLNNCPTSHGNIMHAAAKFGLAESAKEALAQGYYSMLLELDHKKPKSWPVIYAIRNEKWSTLKVILETLNFSQRQAQIRTVVESIDCEKIIKDIRDYQSPWKLINPLLNDNLREKMEMEGRSLLIKAVLDTTMKGCDVDPSLLLLCDESENSSSSTDQQDSGSATSAERSLYNLISESRVEDLKCHPSFAAVVEHQWWRRGYAYFHGLLFVLYTLYLIILTAVLVSAAKSHNPSKYNNGADYTRLFFEIVAILYILTVLTCDGTLSILDISSHCRKRKRNNLDFLMDRITVYVVGEILRYCSTLLIIPLRISDTLFQWHVASLAIMLSGLRLFRYATVLPFMGKYVGTLYLLIKQDLPRLFLVFLVINFSFGTGLYFALVGIYSDENAISDGNSTREVPFFWLGGVELVIEEHILSREDFNWSARVIYWLFVFCVSVAFIAILIAQFETSYTQLANKAHLNVILKKTDIMRKMDRMFSLIKWTPCKKFITYFLKEETCDEISRHVMEDRDSSESTANAWRKLSTKLAENDKRVQLLEGKLDKIHELLLEMKKD